MHEGKPFQTAGIIGELSLANDETVIVTGGSRGIGAAIVQIFQDRGYDVVATSFSFSKDHFAPASRLALVEGDVGQAATAAKIVQTAIGKLHQAARSHWN